MQRVSPKLSTRTSTSFGYWIFGVFADVKYRILRDVEEVSVGVVEELVDKPGITNGT